MSNIKQAQLLKNKALAIPQLIILFGFMFTFAA